MSHFTHMKTLFQNLFYLEKALNQLNIIHKKKLDNQEPTTNLIIPQSNGYDLEFSWNGQEYELIADISFWENEYSIENFIDQIAQKYAGEVVIGEGQKKGFQPVKYQQNSDGSTTLILERWSN